MRIRYTVPAAADLECLLDEINRHSPYGARHVSARIRASEQMLAQFPLSGRRTRIWWLRRLKVARFPYLIFYEFSGDEVVIHAVRHAARAPSSMPDAP